MVWSLGKSSAAAEAPAIPVELSALRMEIERQLREELTAAITQMLKAEGERQALAYAEQARKQERERYEEALGQYQKDVEDDVQARVDRQVAQEQARLKDEWRDQVQEARQAATQWQSRCEAAEQALLELLAQLVPERRKVALGRHATIAQLHLVHLNAILVHHKQRLHGTTTESAFVVECQTPQGPRSLHLFWREHGTDSAA